MQRFSPKAFSVLEKKSFKGFTIYGHGGHLGQWTVTILAIFRSPNLKRFQMNLSKIGSAASEEKSFENVNGRTDDGRKVITIAHPEHSSGELITLCKHIVFYQIWVFLF